MEAERSADTEGPGERFMRGLGVTWVGRKALAKKGQEQRQAGDTIEKCQQRKCLGSS